MHDVDRDPGVQSGVAATDARLKDARNPHRGARCLELPVTGTTNPGRNAPNDGAFGLEQRFRLALEAGGMGTWEWDVASGRVAWDEAMEARYGFARGSFAGTFDAFLELVHPEDVEAARARIFNSLRAKQDLRYEHRVLWPNGEVHWIEGRGRVVLGTDGEPVGMIGVGIDIDRRKETEEAFRLLHELERERTRTAIQVLQHTLVPQDLPSFTGYEIAGRYRSADIEANIGGDWYDAFVLAPDQLLVTIGDVSGHGVLAARTMAKMRHASRAFACEDPTPSTVLYRLAHFFERLDRDEEMVTTVVGILDRSTHTFTLSTAGHPPVLLVSGSATSYAALEPSPPLGALAEPPRSCSIELAPGDTIVLYSDVNVTRPTESLDVGFDRLAHAAAALRREPPSTMCERLLDECDAGLDDACVLVMRRSARASG